MPARGVSEEKLQEIELTIEKIRERGIAPVAGICGSSICTSVCFSTVSSVMVNVREANRVHPDVAAMTAAQYDAAKAVLGEEGLVEAAERRIRAGVSAITSDREDNL